MIDREQVIDVLKSGVSLTEAGVRFGVSRTRIGQIAKQAGIVTRQSPVVDRIKANVLIKDCGHDTPCWVWQGGLCSEGYARITTAGFPRSRGYRVSYLAFVGPIAEGLVLDHLCRNRPCVNPEHLEPVTGHQNTLRGNAANLEFRRTPITHCPHGHEYTAENSYFCKRGTRSCRTCRKPLSGSARRQQGIPVRPDRVVRVG